MPRTKLNIIKPALGVNQMSDGDLLARLNAVYDGMLKNPAYPNPPVDMAGFKAAILERNNRRADAIIMLRLLGHYVEAACKNDMKTFASSGFILARVRQRAPAQPVSIPSILRVDQGNTGQLLVTIHPVPKARGYELRYAAVPAAGAMLNWTTIVASSTKPPTTINDLTPGSKYTFQVRAFGKLGFSDWSGLVERMVI